MIRIMAITKLDNDRVATILVEALFFGDDPVAKKWGIHKRTIQNYRVRLQNNTNGLVSTFKHKKQAFESEWANDVPITIRMALSYIQRASTELEMSPDGVHAITGALKIVAQVGLMKEMMDVRLQSFGYSGEDAKDTEQMGVLKVIPSHIEE